MMSPSGSRSRGRFDFGDNWRRFAAHVDHDRVERAVRELDGLIGPPSSVGETFLDVGSGSGLSSVAASRIGYRVEAFDLDPGCVECTTTLLETWAADRSWSVGTGSILDPAFTQGLSVADVVHSWGVLHHTGQMWRAVEATAALVGDGGRLVLALYNDQGRRSRGWLAVKRLRCSGVAGRWMVDGLFVPYFGARAGAGRLVRKLTGRPLAPTPRGMDRRRDIEDWLGGLPFEVALPSEVRRRLDAIGFDVVTELLVGRGHGCNQFVARRRPA